MSILDIFKSKQPPPPIQKAEEIKSVYSWHSHAKNCECPVCIFHETEKRQFYKTQQQPKIQPQMPPRDVTDYPDIPSYVNIQQPTIEQEYIPPEPKQRKQRIVEPQDNQDNIIRDKLVSQLNERVIALEKLHPELLPKKATPASKTILKWAFFCVLVGTFLYGIYLFYLTTLGYTVNLPF